MESNCSPIGIFDSGAGGLTVLLELLKILPHERYIYYADTANCPYGSKPAETITELSEKITNFLINQQCKLVVVACNTATAAAIDKLRASYKIPFIGMEPAIKPASQHTKTKSIGVLATAGTFKGRLYIETSRKYATDVNVCYQVGEGLVELVEGGMANSPEAESLLRKYIDPMMDCNIDHLVLGCTHYPFLKPLIEKIVSADVTIVDPAPAVALQTKRVAEQNGLTCHEKNNTSQVQVDFYSSSNTDVLRSLVENYVNPYIQTFATYNDNVTL